MIISVAQAQLFFLTLTRILAIIIHVPVLGGQTIPTQVRIGLGFVLALVLIPWKPLPVDALTINAVAYSISIGKEILIGTIIGFASDLTFGAIQIGGSAMGLGSGFESGRIFNPTAGQYGSAFEQIFVMVATAIFLLIDGHHLVLIAIQKTFEIIPINGPLPFNGLESITMATSTMIMAGIQLALPVMTALLITDLTLGLLARVAPQIQVYFLGLPVKIVVSLLALVGTFAVFSPSLTPLVKTMTNNMILFLEK